MENKALDTFFNKEEKLRFQYMQVIGFYLQGFQAISKVAKAMESSDGKLINKMIEDLDKEASEKYRDKFEETQKEMNEEVSKILNDLKGLDKVDGNYC